MDKSRFTSKATGEVKRFQNELTNKSDWQFIPTELPINWEFPTNLWPLLVEAKEALGTLNGIGRTLPDPELLIRPQQTREAIQSSKIEGTVVTPQQLLLYELDPREPASPAGRVADWREVFNYTSALRRGCEMLKELPICNRIIKAMHQELMWGVRVQVSCRENSVRCKFRSVIPGGTYRRRQVKSNGSWGTWKHI